MDEQNPWWMNEKDPYLEKWERSPLRWSPPLLDQFNEEVYSLHFLIGPRQVGKTTMLKILIRDRLQVLDPYSIFYFSCDEIVDHKELGEIIDGYLSMRNARGIDSSLIILDEITFVKEWWRAIKSRIDRGSFRNDNLIITGSTSMDLLGNIDSFPGRRGKGKDIFMDPLSFSEYARIIGGLDISNGPLRDIETNIMTNKVFSSRLGELWSTYLLTGGFPQPIIDHHIDGKVSDITLRSFLDWMRIEWGKAGKRDSYMKQVIGYLYKARGTPVSWNSISSETSINSPHTTRSYLEVLRDMFIVRMLDLITPDGKVLYRKNRKVHITDPFVYRALSSYTNEKLDEGWLIEGTSASLLSRGSEPYYFRNGTEVDIVVKDGKDQIGFEITKGVKSWRKPWHLKEGHLLDRNNIHLYMASIQ